MYLVLCGLYQVFLLLLLLLLLCDGVCVLWFRDMEVQCVSSSSFLFVFVLISLYFPPPLYFLRACSFLAAQN